MHKQSSTICDLVSLKLDGISNLIVRLVVIAGRFPYHLIAFSSQRVAKKTPGFEALKAIPFY